MSDAHRCSWCGLVADEAIPLKDTRGNVTAWYCSKLCLDKSDDMVRDCDAPETHEEGEEREEAS